jgi:hypothetical protein
MATATIALVVACGHKASPKKVAAELPVDDIASIAGDWVSDDDMGWYHVLAIARDGALVGTIDRGKLPKCELAGLVVGAPKQFAVTFTKHTCHPEDQGAPLVFEVVSFTGDTLTLVIAAHSGPERRTYQRKPQ